MSILTPRDELAGMIAASYLGGICDRDCWKDPDFHEKRAELRKLIVDEAFLFADEILSQDETKNV